jgi:hypothetical protein
MEAFQLRLWDGRLGRWLTVDPYGQYDSPYLGMGNNPVNSIDPDGGWETKFGAWWHSLWNGGRVGQDTKFGDYFVYKDTKFDEPNTVGGFREFGGQRYNNFAKDSPGVVQVYPSTWNFNKTADYDLGNFNGGLNILGATSHWKDSKTTGLFGIDTGVSAYLAETNLNARIFTTSTHLAGETRGSLLSAKANLQAGLIESNEIVGARLDANAGAYVADGEATGIISVLGIKTKWTVGASVYSAHAGVTGGFYIDKINKEIVIEGLSHIGFGFGGKLGNEVRIPIFSNSVFN